MSLPESIVFWGAFILAFGGSFVFLAAHFWNQSARFLWRFDRSVNADSGSRVMWYGAAAAVIGFAVLYVIVRPRAPSWTPPQEGEPAAVTVEEE